MAVPSLVEAWLEERSNLERLPGFLDVLTYRTIAIALWIAFMGLMGMALAIRCWQRSPLIRFMIGQTIVGNFLPENNLLWCNGCNKSQ